MTSETAFNIYESLVKDRYLISKRCNTSYLDAGNITPTESKILLKLIMDEIQSEKDLMKDIKLKK